MRLPQVKVDCAKPRRFCERQGESDPAGSLALDGLASTRSRDRGCTACHRSFLKACWRSSSNPPVRKPSRDQHVRNVGFDEEGFSTPSPHLVVGARLGRGPDIEPPPGARKGRRGRYQAPLHSPPGPTGEVPVGVLGLRPARLGGQGRQRWQAALVHREVCSPAGRDCADRFADRRESAGSGGDRSPPTLGTTAMLLFDSSPRRAGQGASHQDPDVKVVVAGFVDGPARAASS